MSKDSDMGWSAEDGHPSEHALLHYVDGELAAKDASSMRAHLEACWSCRVRTEKIQEAISSFIDYRNQVLKPLIDPAPRGWRGFDGRIRRLAAESTQKPLYTNVFGSLKRFFTLSHLSVMPRPMVRVAAVFLFAVIVVSVAIQYKQEPLVSANEFLRHTTEAQATQLRATAQPVIYQKIRLRLKEHVPSNEQIIDLEIWNDTVNSRFRQSLSDKGVQRFLSSNADSATLKIDPREAPAVPAAVAELEQILKANHLDARQPLSPASYQSWRNTLGQKSEEVARTLLPDNLEALTLRTIPTGQVGVGQIAEAALVVRARDWHPIEQHLRVRGEGKDRIYELTETAFQVVSLSALNPAIFDNEKPAAPVAAALPTPNALPAATPSPTLSANLHPQPLVVAPAVATPELEVEVLRLLNSVGADLGEQVSAVRSSDGILRVTGIVETEQRKIEILRALEAVRNNPALRVEIQTVAEALAQQRRLANTSSNLVTVQGVEVASNTIAAEPELRRFFASEGERIDGAVRGFAARMVSASRRSMSHVWAMKRLLKQFSLEEQRTLSPDARSKWLNLIRSHARAYRQESAALRREIQPIFFPEAAPGSGQTREVINDDAELIRAIERLFNLASANDTVIRSAFTASTGSETMTSIKTTQFYQSLQNAEALAERIGVTK